MSAFTDPNAAPASDIYGNGGRDSGNNVGADDGIRAAAVVRSADAGSALVRSGDERSPRLVKEKVAVETDTDSLTRATVAKMCEYIAAGSTDPMVKYWAARAIDCYGLGSREPMPACWGVFWLVKHAVEFARDEPRLFSVGEGDALDMLIAPAVLVRSAHPKEDCDGFTMLICAMLRALEIDCYIVTVAADPSEPDRWSHVFPVAKLQNGATCPLDASHGNFPGWMVPRQHIYRWQAWDMSGAPVDLPMSAGRGLHGYVPRGRRMLRRGMGQDGTDYSSGVLPSTDVLLPPSSDLTTNIAAPVVSSLPSDLTNVGTDFSNWFNSLSAPPSSGSSVPSPSSSAPATNWTSVLNNLISGTTKLTQEALLPAGGYITTSPSGASTISTGGSGVNLSTGGLGSLLPLLLVGGLAVLLISAMGRHK